MQQHGFTLDLIPFRAWYQKVVDTAAREPSAELEALKEMFAGHDGGPPTDEDFRFAVMQPRFDARNVEQLLAGTGIACPPVDDKLLTTYVGFLAGHGVVGETSAAAAAPSMSSIGLNHRAALLFDRLITEANALRIAVHDVAGAKVVDLGIDAVGGLEAGRRLAELCLAGFGEVSLAPPDKSLGPWPTVVVRTDRPIESCLFAQYAGWQVAKNEYFAMASGPMRAAYGGEALFTQLGYREASDVVVGILETHKLPTPEVIAELAAKCGVAPSGLRLCVAPTASLAGTLQVVARSIETALHKLHELGFDVRRVSSAFGSAPLPPVGKNDLASLGRTNDAILYGGDVQLWVRGDDASLEAVGPRVPASASCAYGKPFVEIFEAAGRDFYKIDPLLFSPAVVSLLNLDTGRSFRYGETNADVLRRSFNS
jgi:methenyltetrahydromethanopterin cyclohydrolase